MFILEIKFAQDANPLIIIVSIMLQTIILCKTFFLYIIHAGGTPTLHGTWITQISTLKSKSVRQIHRIYETFHLSCQVRGAVGRPHTVPGLHLQI